MRVYTASPVEGNLVQKTGDFATEETIYAREVQQLQVRGPVVFRIKGNDVVVTRPDGTFVSVLKDGVNQNTSVQNALRTP